MSWHLHIDKGIMQALKYIPHEIVQHQARLDDYSDSGRMMKHGHVSEAIIPKSEGILHYSSCSGQSVVEDAPIACQVTKSIGLERMLPQLKRIVTNEVVWRRLVIIGKWVWIW
jgi:hypothetical protein